MEHKVLILGDSLAFPRNRHSQRLQDVWPQLISSSTYQVLRSRPASTSYDVLSEVSLLSDYFGEEDTFDFCIIQVGIVDCCPRGYPFFVERLFRKLAKLRSLEGFIKTLFFFRKKEPWISQESFYNNIKIIFTLASNFSKKVIFIPIMRADNYLIENESDINKYIGDYNKSIFDKLKGEGFENFYFLNLDLNDDEGTEHLLLPDGHHLSSEGHSLISKKLLSLMLTLGR